MPTYSDNFAASAPATEMALITPHNTNALDPVPKALRFDGAGTVTFQALGSSTDVVITAIAGEILPVRARFIRSTGTTVATIHGLY